MNPSLVDAWLCLGNCIWKKGDLNAAKNCFTFALSKVIYAAIALVIMISIVKSFIKGLQFLIDIFNLLCFQGLNKNILCQLSMLERKLAQGEY